MSHQSIARPLTHDEINRLLTVIPEAPINTKFPRAVMTAQIQLRERLRYQLKTIKIIPAMLDELYFEIKRQYEVSIVQPGKAVGIDMSQSFGESSTQSTLNTFHLSGVASNVTGGIQGFKELINAREKRVFESIMVHFISDRSTMGDIVSFGGEIAHLAVNDLVLDYETVSTIDTFEDGYPAAYPYWYQVYVEWHPNLKTLMFIRESEESDQLIPLISFFLRIILDVDTMYSRGITMEEVCRKITLNSRDKKKGSNPTVLCIPSPINLGIIDIYPIIPNISTEKVNFSALGDDPVRMRSATEEAYISAATFPSLGEITLRGIKGITELVPTHYKIIQTKSGERFLSYHLVANTSAALSPALATSSSAEIGPIQVRKRWEMTIDARKYRTTSLTIGKFLDLITEVGIKIEELTINPSMYEVFNTEIFQPVGGTRDILRARHILVNLAISESITDQLTIEQIRVRLNQGQIPFKDVPNESIVGVSTFKLVVLVPEESEEDPVRRLRSALADMRKLDKPSLELFQFGLMNEFLTGYITSVKVVDSWWRLDFDPGWLERLPAGRTDFDLMLRKFNIKYSIFPNHVNIQFIDLSPSAVINQALRRDREIEERARDEGKIQPPSRLKSLSRYHFGFTKGANLPELLKHPMVNPNFTYANNMYHNIVVFGIEMTRMSLIQEFIEVLNASKSSLNIQHVLLLVDYMTRAGNITKISANGVISRDTSTLAKTSVTRAMEVFFRAAAFGERDVGLKDVSSSIMVGKRVQTGTGYGEYPVYQAALERLREAQRTGSHLSDQGTVTIDIDGLSEVDGLTPEGLESSINELSWSHNGLEGDISGGDIIQLPIIEGGFDPSIILEQARSADIHPSINSAPIVSDHVANIIASLQDAPCISKSVDRVEIEPTFGFDQTSIQRTVIINGETTEITIILPTPRVSELSLPSRIADDINRTLHRTVPIDSRTIPPTDPTAPITGLRMAQEGITTVGPPITSIGQLPITPQIILPVMIGGQITLSGLG